MTVPSHERANQMNCFFPYQWNVYLLISSCQYLINGLKEIYLHQQNAAYVMKYVEVNGGSRDSDVFGVI